MDVELEVEKRQESGNKVSKFVGSKETSSVFFGFMDKRWLLFRFTIVVFAIVGCGFRLAGSSSWIFE